MGDAACEFVAGKVLEIDAGLVDKSPVDDAAGLAEKAGIDDLVDTGSYLDENLDMRELSPAVGADIGTWVSCLVVDVDGTGVVVGIIVAIEGCCLVSCCASWFSLSIQGRFLIASDGDGFLRLMDLRDCEPSESSKRNSIESMSLWCHIS